MFQFIRNAVKPVATKALRFAVAKNWGFLAKVSAFCGADVNDIDIVNGCTTPLHICKSQKMCDLLLSKGANAFITNSNNETALQKLSEKNINVLWSAIFRKDLELMRLLLEKGTDANYPAIEGPMKGYPPIWYAVRNGEIEMVSLLLDNGANINYSASQGHVTGVLERNGLNNVPSYKTVYKDVNLLLLARDGNKTEIVELLLEKDVNVSFKERQETLCWAAVHNAKEVAKILLEKGADVNHMMTEGIYKNLTPLWFAVSHNNLDLAGLFIQNNANINYINNQGRTLLMAETVKGNVPIIEFLLKNGATVDLNQQAWKTTLINTRCRRCIALIKNAQEVKPILTMLALQKKKSATNPELNKTPSEIFMGVKTMLTGYEITKPKAKLT